MLTNRISSIFARRAGLALLSVVLLASFAQPASAGWWYKSSKTLLDKLEADGRFQTLLVALDVTGLDAALDGDDDLTVFAPTDEAFAALPDGAVGELVAAEEAAEPGQGPLTNILLYHVLGGKKYASRLLRNTTTVTLQGDPVLVLNGSPVTINGGTFAATNRRASNGLYHVVNNVLLPPEQPVDVQSLVDVLALDGRFDTLITAVTAADLGDTLATGGPFTVFAPTDDAFAALPAGALEGLLDDTDALTDVLLYHVLSGKFSSIALYYAQTAVTLLGAPVSITYSSGTLRINDAAVINRNANTPNGYIHVIDEVLLPPAGDAETPSLVTVLQEDGRFTTLLAALAAAELDEVVASGGPFTILAPTDDAFAALPEGTVSALLSDIPALTNILLYHVIDGRRGIFSLWFERFVPTLQGQNVEFRFKDGRLRVNGNRIRNANTKAPNGLIHVVDGVLLP